jgi:fructosamine-3-kinase
VSLFRRRVAELTGVAEDQLQRLGGGDLSEALLVQRPDGRKLVAKSGMVAAEAAMLRSMAEAGVPVPLVEGEYESVLLLDHVANDNVFSPRAWGDFGAQLRRLHRRTDEQYGWPVDFAIGLVEIGNLQTRDWPGFWAELRLVAVAATLDRPWRDRVAVAAQNARERLPAHPVPAHLHGDLWTGNVLVQDGRLAALIDPACYFGDPEVDLAMLTLFAEPPPEFWGGYGALEPGWQERRPLYQLFPALLHMRLFGPVYGGMVDRLLTAAGA